MEDNHRHLNSEQDDSQWPLYQLLVHDIGLRVISQTACELGITHVLSKLISPCLELKKLFNVL